MTNLLTSSESPLKVVLALETSPDLSRASDKKRWRYFEPLSLSFEIVGNAECTMLLYVSDRVMSLRFSHCHVVEIRWTVWSLARLVRV